MAVKKKHFFKNELLENIAEQKETMKFPSQRYYFLKSLLKLFDE